MKPKNFLIALLLTVTAVFTFSTRALADGPQGGSVLYVVQYGDTLESIASKFGVPLEAILQANGWTQTRGYYPVGQQMYLPSYGGAPYGSGNASTYIVQYGDTLFSIARRYGVSIYALMRANGIYNPNFIYAGMRLFIPRSNYPPPSYNTYVIRFGDTLSSIAVRFGTTVYALMIANNLPNPNLIFAGMRLMIPSSHSYPPPAAGYPTAQPPVAGPSPTPITGNPLILLKNIAYNPKTITIHVGSIIQWRNDETSAIQHTVTSGSPGAPSSLFDSPTLNQGQTFQFTFNTAGTIAYYCRIHGASMTGTITVVP